MGQIRAFRLAQTRVRFFMLLFASFGFPAGMVLFFANLFAALLV